MGFAAACGGGGDAASPTTLARGAAVMAPAATVDATTGVSDANPGSVEGGAPDSSSDADARPFVETVYSDVLTHRYDNLRTGANLNESILAPANVGSLHPLFSATVDGQIYAQPLYVHGVTLEGGTRSLLLVATMEDSVYAFDADDGSPVWHDTIGTPAFSQRNVGGDNGILSTPVIDRLASTLYVVVRDCDPSQPATAPSCAQRLIALDLRDGSILRSVAMAGQTSGSSGVVTFDPNAQWSRTALLLDGGLVYAAFAAGPNGNEHEEDFEYHGWVFAYTANDFAAAPRVYCSTPNGKGGGIWQSGHGLASDGTSVYFATGNSIIGSTTQSPSTFASTPVDTEDSLVKWTQPTQTPVAMASYYDSRPYHPDGDVFQYMESNDVEIGASGPVLLPGTQQVVVSGKSGTIYNIDRETMQEVQPPLSLFTHPPLASGQSLYVYSYAGDPTINGALTFWQPNAAGDANADAGADASADMDADASADAENEDADASANADASGDADANADADTGPQAFGLLYAWPQNDYLKALRYDFATHLIATTPAATAANPVTSAGGMLSLSANGGAPGTGILWATSTLGSAGHLWAFNAETLAMLWDTAIPNFAKFVPPVIVNGTVFVASSAAGASTPASVVAFGL
jgi:hypothetical protein